METPQPHPDVNKSTTIIGSIIVALSLVLFVASYSALNSGTETNVSILAPGAFESYECDNSFQCPLPPMVESQPFPYIANEFPQYSEPIPEWQVFEPAQPEMLPNLCTSLAVDSFGNILGEQTVPC